MKKKLKQFTTILVFVSFVFVAIATGNDEKTTEVECDSSSRGYKLGYEVGKESIYDNPATYKRECNNGYGMIGEVPPCWDEGFIDGYNSEKK